MTTALVSNIQKCCVHDGPGLRTVVFLMGCPLRCKWCQNPENLATRPIVLFDRDKCLACGRCLPACKEQCSAPDADGRLQIDRARCVGCGVCAERCYIEAKSVCGRRMTVGEVYDAVMRDQVFYRDSGGGVTLSGGEPLLHTGFCTELLGRLREAGVHTAVETCGFASPGAILRMAKQTDLFLYDCKAFSDDIHRQWTGQSNETIKQNLEQLLALGKSVIVRIPLIPGVNDGDEFDRMMRYLAQLKGVRKVHLMPFHQIGSSKYVLSDTPYAMGDVPECSIERAQQHASIAERCGFDVNIGGWDADMP